MPQKRSRRTYSRRSDDERVAELEQRLAALKARQAAQELKEDPVLRAAPRLQRALKKFAQLALDNQRPDIANSVLAWNAQMDRILHAESRAGAE